jgi:lactoylglutathione lyase
MVAKETPESTMRYLHTMIRAANLEAYRYDNEAGRFTLVFLSAPEDLEAAKARQAPLVEITYNWDPEQYDGGRNFGHLAYQVDDIYATCQHLLDKGVILNRPPRDGRMAFIKSPDGISIELLQAGEALPTQEPWASMPNTGNW